MFKLDSSHIGKKVKVFYDPSMEWVIPISFRDGEMDEQLIKLVGKGPYYRRFPDDSRWGGIDVEWVFVAEDTSFFDLSRFGCHAGAVKDLLTALDKRYVLQQGGL